MVNLRLTVHASLGLVILLLHRQQRSSSDGISSVRKASAQTAQQIFLACFKEKGTQTGHVQRIPGRWPPKWRLLSCNRHFYKSAYLAKKKATMPHLERGCDCATKHMALFYQTHQEHQEENTREKNLLTENVGIQKNMIMKWPDS